MRSPKSTRFDADKNFRNKVFGIPPGIYRGDSMIFTFDIPPKMGSLGTAKYDR